MDLVHGPFLSRITGREFSRILITGRGSTRIIGSPRSRASTFAKATAGRPRRATSNEPRTTVYDSVKYVAFIRAINVAGHASVKMSDARDAFVAAGGRNVRSYIQSGNVLFECSAREMASMIRAVKKRLTDTRAGEPDILCRSEQKLEEIVRRAPFTARDTGPAVKLYVAFLARSPRVKPRLPVSLPKEELEAVGMTDREVFIVSRRKKSGFFGFPNNFIEDALGVPATTRNWSTITRILDIVRRDAVEPSRQRNS